MSQFDRLRVRGFRRLADADVELRPLTVLIGANGSGKTSILDVLSMLAKSARGGLNTALSELSGLAAILTHDHADSLSLGLSMTVAEHEPLEYLLQIRPGGTAYIVTEETLSQRRPRYDFPFLHITSNGADVKYYEVANGRLVRPTWEYNPLETSLSQVPKMFREPEQFRNRLASSTFYHVLNVDARSPVRLPQSLGPASLPGPNGEDLVSCLFYLRETDRDRFDEIEETMRAAFTGFERLEFPPVAAGTLALTWRDSRFSKPLFMHQLSEGILRFLWLTTLLRSPGLTALTLLDEPEVSLHPELLSLLAGILREAAKRTQIVVATHSDRLIRFLEPAEVAVINSDEAGLSHVARADTLDLERWLDEYGLDELWRMGRLGARD